MLTPPQKKIFFNFLAISWDFEEKIRRKKIGGGGSKFFLTPPPFFFFNFLAIPWDFEEKFFFKDFFAALPELHLR